MAIYEIPLVPGPQTLTVAFPNGTAQLRLVYANAANGEGSWLLDVATSAGTPIVCGIPLVTGADLLAQFAYLNIGVVMFCETDGDLSLPPTFDTLGVTARLYVEY